MRALITHLRVIESECGRGEDMYGQGVGEGEEKNALLFFAGVRMCVFQFITRGELFCCRELSFYRYRFKVKIKIYKYKYYINMYRI